MRMPNHANKLETNVEVKSQNFGIGNASVVIDILRNRLYEHKIRTLVQEYISNGRDAQREVGSKEQLIVTIPNALSPTFKVRDFGPGITPDRMANVFVMYGSSTKRDTNNQVGGFGIGAKSAWSYTDSFTIITFVDGTKRTYVAHTGVNNQGRLDLLSTEDTTEPNGTEIQIAVKNGDWNEFKDAALRATYFWKATEKPAFKGITAIDVPEEFTGFKISPTLVLTERGLPAFLELNSYRDKAILVIDGIPYTVTERLTEHVKNLEAMIGHLKSTAVMFVNNGTVEVSASRESLADSDFTREHMNKLCMKYTNEILSFIQAKFKAVKSNAQWIETYHALSQVMHVDGHAKYGNYTIQHGSVYSDDFNQLNMTRVSLKHKRNGLALDRDTVTSIPIKMIDQVFYVGAEESHVIRHRRMKEYLGNDVQSLILIEAPTNVPPKDGTLQKAVDVKLVAKAMKNVTKDFSARDIGSLSYTPIVRVPKAQQDRTKEMFTIHMMSNGRKSPRTKTLEAFKGLSNKHLYIRFNDVEKYMAEVGDLSSYLETIGIQVCAATDKVIEILETDEHFSKYEDWKKDFTPTKELIKAVKYHKAQNRHAMTMLKRATLKIDNAHVSKMVEEYKPIIKDMDKPCDTLMRWTMPEIKAFLDDDKELTETLKDKFPLVNTLAYVNGEYDRVKTAEIDEVVFYMNQK